MYYYVYQITNLLNGKIYVGKHKSAKHPSENKYYGSGKQITAAIKKYGIENFKKEVIHYCSSMEEMSNKEAEIVTEDFVKRTDTYNMHKGGPGGWDHYNGTNAHRKNSSKGGKKTSKQLNEFIAEQKTNNTEWWKDWCSKVSKSNKNKNNNGWINFTPEEYQKRRLQKSLDSSGEKNSQFGKFWISNVLTKEVRRITINDTMPEGWVRGKKGHIPKKLWVNNGVKEHYILIEKEQEYVSKGFSSGRLKSSMLRKSIVV
jgi:Putative endonuclease segE, GIY-YIG domain